MTEENQTEKDDSEHLHGAMYKAAVEEFTESDDFKHLQAENKDFGVNNITRDMVLNYLVKKGKRIPSVKYLNEQERADREIKFDARGRAFYEKSGKMFQTRTADLDPGQEAKPLFVLAAPTPDHPVEGLYIDPTSPGTNPVL